MKHISELKSILGDFLNWNNARLVCFTQALIGLFRVRTVNLREIAVAMDSQAQPDSRYKRLKRFFAHFSINSNESTGWIFQLYFKNKENVYLTIDRTNWFFGRAKINILTLGVAYEGVAIPLFWNLLNKAGNATAIEHEKCIGRFIHLFGKTGIQGVLGDREFASGALFHWLNKHTIPFYIRIKEDSLVALKKSQWRKALHLFQHLNPKEKYTFPMTVWLYGQKVYLAGARSERGELMIVATHQKPINAIEIYLRRWEIECLFQALKTRGFRFEQTHLTKPERIEKLICLLAIGFCWAHKVGEWRAIIKPIIFNQHKTSLRPQYAYFRYGLDWIRDLVFNLSSTRTKWREILQLLKVPPPSTEHLR